MNDQPPASPPGYGPAFRGDGQEHDKSNWMFWATSKGKWDNAQISCVASSDFWYCKPLPKPNWRPIEEFDLKMGERYWRSNGKDMMWGYVNSLCDYRFFKEHGWTHFHRNEAPYLIPEPPEKEVRKPLTTDQWCEQLELGEFAMMEHLKSFCKNLATAIKNGEVVI